MEEKMRFFLIAAMIITTSFAMQAADAEAAAKPEAQPLEKSTPIQVGFWFDTPECTKTSNVYGFKTGQVVSSGIGRVYGLEASWIISATETIGGVQTAAIGCTSKKLDGVQAAIPYCMNNEELNGLQASLVNLSCSINGFQPGAVNVAEDIHGLQLAVLANISQDVSGMQAGVTNYAKNLNGVQLSVVNVSGGGDCMQIGLVNVGFRRGIQFGLVNYIRDGWFPFCPFVNYSWKIVRHLD
jgi:hypothetical protein